MTAPASPLPPAAPPDPSRRRRRSPAVWGDNPGFVGGLRYALEIVTTALRLLARHWPALLTLFLAGVVAHELAMRAAVRVSRLNAELGMLTLLLAPMATLTALVLMLRVVRPSLPRVAGDRPTSMLEHLGSVLVPFLTIYYFEDYLTEDLNQYAYRIWEDESARYIVEVVETLDTGEEATPIDTLGRLPYDLSVTLVAVVAATIVARWLLSRWRATQRHTWLGIPGAYLELVWLTLVYLAFIATSQRILDWGGDRRIVHGVRTVWDEAVGVLGGVVPPFQNVLGSVTAQLWQLDAVLLVPLAWLAVGAVVLGHQPPPVWRSPTRRAAKDRRQRLYEQAERRWQAAPRLVRWAGEKITEDLRGRFTPLVQGERMLLRAGVAPMLVFCLAFVTARVLKDWLWELQRLLIGPQDVASVWLPLSWPFGTLDRGVGDALLVCLVAAAVDRAAAHRPGDPIAPPPPAQPSENRT